MSDGLWANIHAKRKRIKAGSGETMRTPPDLKGLLLMKQLRVVRRHLKRKAR